MKKSLGWFFPRSRIEACQVRVSAIKDFSHASAAVSLISSMVQTAHPEILCALLVRFAIPPARKPRRICQYEVRPTHANHFPYPYRNDLTICSVQHRARELGVGGWEIIGTAEPGSLFPHSQTLSPETSPGGIAV